MEAFEIVGRVLRFCFAFFALEVPGFSGVTFFGIFAGVFVMVLSIKVIQAFLCNVGTASSKFRPRRVNSRTDSRGSSSGSTALVPRK